MSMAEIIEKMTERGRAQRQADKCEAMGDGNVPENGKLPWQCQIRKDICIHPEINCIRCEVYRNMKGEQEHDNQD